MEVFLVWGSKGNSVCSGGGCGGVFLFVGEVYEVVGGG